MEISELNQQMCHGKRFFTMDSSGVVAVCVDLAVCMIVTIIWK